MADGVVVVQPDSTGKKIDTSEITVGANTVERQRVNLADPTDPAGLAAVKNVQPVGTEYGQVVREAGHPAQGSDATLAVGPMTQALVNDSPPQIYITGTLQPLSMTPEGRLRVASMASNAMENFWPDPFAQDLTFDQYPQDFDNQNFYDV